MWRVWIKIFDGDTLVSESVSANFYSRKCDATRYAKRNYSGTCGRIRFEWIVAESNPFEKEI